MSSIFPRLPTKKEEYAIVSRQLTEQEIQRVVEEVYDDTLIWHEDPRSWLTFGGFLGFQMSKAMFRYSIGHYGRDDAENDAERNGFVQACQSYAIEQGESL